MWVPKRGVAQDLDTTMWVTNGTVSAIAKSGNTIYIGGKFELIGPNTGPSILIDPTIQKREESFPRVEGIVHASLPDGKGGWYIAGVFSKVGSAQCFNIAHIHSDYTVDQKWAPSIQYHSSDNSKVNAMVIAGNRLYLGGYGIAKINEQVTGNLAAIEISTGEVVTNLPRVSSAVNALTAKSNLLYVGGEFKYISDKSRNGLATIDVTTSLVTDWDPEIDYHPYNGIKHMALGGNILYVAGSFNSIGGKERSGFAAIDTQTGKPTDWQSKVTRSGSISALTCYGTRLYVTGWPLVDDHSVFVASIDCRTGEWMPIESGSENMRSHSGKQQLYSYSITGFKDKVYAVGDFIDPQSNLSSIAVIDTAMGRTVPSSMRIGGKAMTISADQERLYVGGQFDSFGGVFRSNAAAIDTRTGIATGWNPAPNDVVNSIAAYGNRVFMHGFYNQVGGKTQTGLLEVNHSTGQVIKKDLLGSENNELNGTINTLIVSDSILYVADVSDRLSLGKNQIVVIDLRTNARTNWLPAVNGIISAITVHDSVTYVAAGEYRIGTHQIYAFNTQTGKPVPSWQSITSESSIESLCVAGQTLFAAGWFWEMEGEARRGLAAIDLKFGYLKPWNPNKWDGDVVALAADNNVLYVGGDFSQIEGKPRRAIASFNLETGSINDWTPFHFQQFYFVNKLVVVDNTLYVGDGDVYDDLSGNKSIFRRLRGFSAFTKRSEFKTNKINGRIYEDVNGNCQKEVNEKSLSGYIIKAEPGGYLTQSDHQGNYSLEVGKGTFTVSQVLPKSGGLIISQTCPPNSSYSIAFDSNNETKTGFDFGNQVINKPFLKVNVSASRRRRCFSSTTTIYYRNEGFASASNVQVQVTYPQYVIPLSANTPWSSRKDSVLTFDLGTLQAGQSGRITLIDSVICGNEAIRGLTQCVKATIIPKNNLKAPDPKWDQSDLELKAVCKDNGFVRLTLLNSGVGAMADSASYRIYLDAVKVFEAKYKLSSKDSLNLEVPANGRTVRLEADLRPFHPDGARQPSITLEGCGRAGAVTISKGFVNQLPQDDALEEVAISCLPILDSYDPNDKQASPIGVGPQHLITEKDELEYLIRFQNTGTDVAYNVIVTDTLDEHLDIATLQIGTASHPYSWKLSGQGSPVITWTFSNINLPDSTHNEPQSHGYLRFRIGQKADNPLGTTIANQAAITFDYNSPILTNLTTHIVGEIPQQLSSTAVDVCKGNYPTQANAGEDQVTKDLSTADLAANVPVKGYGQWRLISGKGTVDVATNPKAKVSDLGVGKNVFEWAITFCDSTSTSRVTIERIVLPLSPQVSNPDPTCAGEAIPMLKAEGSNLIWYDDAALSRQLFRGATYQPIVSATDTFYVTQTVNGYESKPSSVILTVKANPQPPALQNPAPYCIGEFIEPITATGENIQWYADRELTQRLFRGARYEVSPQVTTRYYATQTVNGCSSEPAQITVTILPRPAAPAVVSNYRVYCQGENMEPLEAVGENLRWYADAQLKQLVGTGPIYQPNVSVSSHFYVTQTVANCEGAAAVVPVTIQPAKISVEAKGDTLIAPEGSAFQWYCEGQLLAKATAQEYIARNTGHYHVVMKKESCPVASEPVLVTVNVPYSVLTLAPNPSPDRVQVTLTANATGPVELRMYNTLGRVVYQTEWHKPTTILIEELNIAQLPRGLYFVEVSTRQETLIRKVVRN